MIFKSGAQRFFFFPQKERYKVVRMVMRDTDSTLFHIQPIKFPP